MDSIIVFFAQGAFVFLLGSNTLNVVRHQLLAAFLTSMGIGTCQLFVLSYVVKALETNDWFVYGAFLLGGSCGIVTSMFVGKR